MGRSTRAGDRCVLVLVTGEPLASTVAQRGDFVTLTREGAGDVGASWSWNAADVRRDPAAATAAAERADALIVTGSAARLGQREPWMEPTLELLRGAVARGQPTLGVCFGHQLLGEALGGRVGPNPRGREIGTVPLEVLGDNPLVPLASSGSRCPTVNMTHLDSVLELPPGASVHARTALEPHATVRFGERAWGVQFHPEVDAEVLRDYLDARALDIAAEGVDPAAIRDALGDAPAGRAVLARFLELAADRP